MREVTNGAHWSQKCTLTTLANDTKKLSVSKPGVDSMKPGCRCELDQRFLLRRNVDLTKLMMISEV